MLVARLSVFIGFFLLLGSGAAGQMTCHSVFLKQAATISKANEPTELDKSRFQNPDAGKVLELYDVHPFSFQHDRLGKHEILKQTISPLETVSSFNDGNGVYRALVHSVAATENLLIETFDTEFRSHLLLTKEVGPYLLNKGIIPSLESFNTLLTSERGVSEAYDLVRRSLSPTEVQQLESELLHNGRSVQKEKIDEILDFILPLYADRRGWSDSFIRDLRSKAYSSLNNTRYIVIRDRSSKKIIATLGLTRSTYGKVKFFNKVTQAWEIHTGPFGTAYMIDHVGGNGSRSLRDSALKAGIGLPEDWSGHIGQLPMEEFFGKSIELPRPVIPEFFGNHDGHFQWYARNWHLHQFPPGINPDLTKEVYFYTGEIFEPTKFALVKSATSRQIAYAEIFRELFDAVFPVEKGDYFNVHAQYLYTYNDEPGIHLYRRMGFEVLPSDQPLIKDGTQWTLLGMSPTALAKRTLEVGVNAEDIARDFLRAFEKSMSTRHTGR